MASLDDINSTLKTGVSGLGALITAVQNLTTALSSTVVIPSRTFINIKDKGGVGDGATDNTAAFNAAYAAVGTTGGTIYFPQGKYFFATAQTAVYPLTNAIFDLTLLGDGTDASILVWGATTGLTVVYEDSSVTTNNQSFHARDLAFTTTTTGINGLVLTQSGAGSGAANSALTELTRVAFRGDDGYIGNVYWTNQLTLNAICNVNLNGCGFFGPAIATGGGVNVAGIDGSRFAIVLNLIGCTINNCGIGLNIGSFVQGVSLANCNLTDNSTAINIGAGLSGGDVQLLITGSQIGIPTGTNGIVCASQYNAILLSSNLFVMGTSGIGVSISPSYNYVLTGNQFNGAVGTSIGVQIGSTVAGSFGVIGSNGFINLGTGIQLQAGATSVGIGPNSFVGVTTEVDNTVANASLTKWHNKGGVSGFIVELANTNATVNAHACILRAGSNGSTDASTQYWSFTTPDALHAAGQISRNDAGAVYQVSYGTTSDERLKKNIRPTLRGLDTLRDIQVIDFGVTGRPVQALLAQQCFSVYPEAVTPGDDDVTVRPWQMDYGRLTPLLVRAVQQLAEKVEALENGIP